MATATTTASAISNDATWRERHKFISDLLTAGGIPKTADSGQIDLTTATQPGSNNTAAGYEMRRFADTLQATKPIFFKIEYGRDGGANSTSHWLTIGTGSDGSGNITGILFARKQISVGSATGNSSQPCYGCALPGMFWFLLDKPDTNTQTIFVLTRTHDTAGIATGGGFRIVWGKGQSNIACHFVNYTTGVETREGAATGNSSPTVSPCFTPPVSVTNGTGPTSGTLSNGDTAIYPIWSWDQGILMPPLADFAMGYDGNFTDLNEYDVKISNADIHVKAFACVASVNLNRGTGSVINRRLLRWE